jgi:oligosaccharide repeat unit polymerase
VYFVFLATLILFNASQAFLLPWVPADADLLDPQYKYLMTRLFQQDLLVQTFSVVGAFISAFHSGALATAFAQRKRPADQQVRRIPDADRRMKALSVWVLAMFALSAPLGASQIYSSMSIVMEKGYFGLYDPTQQVYQSAFGVLATFALPAAIYLAFLRTGFLRYAGLSYVLLHGGAMLVMGFRAWGMLTLIALAWTVHKTVFPISQRTVFGGVLLLVLLLPLIGATRNTALTEIDMKKVSEAYEEVGSPVFSLLSETGGSAGTVAWTITLVPAERDYGFGLSYLNSATAVVPNLWGGTHASTEGSLSRWLVWRVSPENAALGGGVGFSAIAELYYNFGFPLGALAALLAGGVVGWASRFFELNRNDPIVCAAAAVILTFLPMYARSDSSILFRPLVWFVIAPLYATRLLGFRQVAHNYSIGN